MRPGGQSAPGSMLPGMRAAGVLVALGSPQAKEVLDLVADD